MGMPAGLKPHVRFGAFELDAHTRELRTSGRTLKLQEQPFQVLTLLLEHPGQLVTRDELKARLWASETFVDFDSSINKAVNRLREALQDSAGQPKYIETLPRLGYRLVVPVESFHEATVGEHRSVSGSHVEFSERTPRKLWVILATCIAAIAMAAGGAWYLRSGRTAQIESLAVLPFTNVSGDGNTEYLSDGITESLIDNLAHVPQLKVKSRHSVFRYKGKDVDVPKLGKDLGVSALVSGRVMPRGDSIEVSAELTDVRDNTQVWGQHYSGKRADIILLQQQIAGDIGAILRSKLSTSEKQRVTKQGTQNPEAYELYLKGRYYWNKRTAADLETAISYFNQAIARDPGYALAYSGLADTYVVLPAYGRAPTENVMKANAAARKALELDVTLAHPHAVLGSNEVEYEWDFAGGEAEFKKALELDPNDATVHQWYAANVGTISGRWQEALVEINRARQLDPLSAVITENAGDIYVAARQYDEAIVICKKLANENPTFAMAHFCLTGAYYGKRMYPQLIEELKVYGQLSGDRNVSDVASALDQGFRSGGWKGALTKGIEILQAQRKTGYQSAYVIADFYAELGDKEQAFRWLNIAIEERDRRVPGLKTDFDLDPLRSDPRFRELVRKVGLPQ
jgi:TolB-like protein/DNA-binding winged helix-turn-helix (wHTH) protein